MSQNKHATESAPKMSTGNIVARLVEAKEDFEWYPTTSRMILAVTKHVADSGHDIGSVLDVGAGDGRVLQTLSEILKANKLYAIEKSLILTRTWPENVTPAGSEFYEQDLSFLKVDLVYCNPPYSEYEAWTKRIIDTANTKQIYLVLPRRWKNSVAISDALRRRKAKATVIHEDDFLDGERRARAEVDVVAVSIDRYERSDPFDLWFDENITGFDKEEEGPFKADDQREVARINALKTAEDIVRAYEDDHARMEKNYEAIFKLDRQILSELGVDKTTVRERLKDKMGSLKVKYWTILFDRLYPLTSRLSTRTKRSFTERLCGRAGIAFTLSNIQVVMAWAVRNAERYFDQQLTQLFMDLSTFDGVLLYKSNQDVWEKDRWRYARRDHDRYALDYRIIVAHRDGIVGNHYSGEGNLARSAHELLDDIIAVFSNLGFGTEDDGGSRKRTWEAGKWQDFLLRDSGKTLFQAKSFLNGNVHLRFMPEAIRCLNVEAGRLLGWLRGPDEAVAETGCSEEEARRWFGSNLRLGAAVHGLLSIPFVDES
jgi:hypothetical protein